MVSIEQLRKERDKLKKEQMKLQEKKRLMMEKKQLQREVNELRNPKSQTFKKNLKSGLTLGGKATLRFLDQITRPVPQRKRVMKVKRRKKR